MHSLYSDSPIVVLPLRMKVRARHARRSTLILSIPDAGPADASAFGFRVQSSDFVPYSTSVYLVCNIFARQRCTLFVPYSLDNGVKTLIFSIPEAGPADASVFKVFLFRV